MKHIDTAYVQALARIAQCKAKIICFQYATNGSGNRGTDSEYSSLWTSLYRNLNDAYRDAFMWGLVSMDKKKIAEARKMAVAHFLKKHNSIIGYLELSGDCPSSWQCADEEAFRKEIKGICERIKTEC